MNHPELFLGGLELDLMNAPPLAVLQPEQQSEFKQALDDFDQHQITRAEFIKRINEKVYRHTYDENLNETKKNPSKFHALNLLSAESMEIRGVRPQESYSAFKKAALLFQNRMQFLDNLNYPIKYQPKNYSNQVSFEINDLMHIYHVDISPNKIESVFRHYVEQSGFKWSEYKELMTKELQRKLNESSK
jgi:hypothetical protein